MCAAFAVFSISDRIRRIKRENLKTGLYKNRFTLLQRRTANVVRDRDGCILFEISPAVRHCRIAKTPSVRNPGVCRRIEFVAMTASVRRFKSRYPLFAGSPRTANRKLRLLCDFLPGSLGRVFRAFSIFEFVYGGRDADCAKI